MPVKHHASQCLVARPVHDSSATQVKVLFDEMLSCSLSPSLISYNTLLHAYAKMGAWQESLALLQHLCTR
jgi:pentatricopeptide repeat protein